MNRSVAGDVEVKLIADLERSGLLLSNEWIADKVEQVEQPVEEEQNWFLRECCDLNCSRGNVEDAWAYGRGLQVC